GWSPKHNREKMAVSETVQLFDLPQILRHNARFDMEKLRWLDGEYVREMPSERFQQMALAALQRADVSINNYSNEYVHPALETCRGKIKRFAELPAYGGFYFSEQVNIDPADVTREFTAEAKARLQKLADGLRQSPQFDAANIEKALKSVAAELGIKAGP